MDLDLGLDLIGYLRVSMAQILYLERAVEKV